MNDFGNCTIALDLLQGDDNEILQTVLTNAFPSYEINYKQTSNNAHATVACIRRLMSLYIKDCLNDKHADKKIINVGGRPTTFNENYVKSHSISPIIVPGDRERIDMYVDYLVSQTTNTKSNTARRAVNHLITDVNTLCNTPTAETESMCFNDLARCRYKADVAVSIDSTYDINALDFFRDIITKGVQTAYVTMILPRGLVNAACEGKDYLLAYHWYISDTCGACNTVNGGDMLDRGSCSCEPGWMRFQFNDTAYTHRLNTITSWMLPEEFVINTDKSYVVRRTIITNVSDLLFVEIHNNRMVRDPD